MSPFDWFDRVIDWIDDFFDCIIKLVKFSFIILWYGIVLIGAVFLILLPILCMIKFLFG